MMNTASKQRPVEKENWIRVENTHEPIIDRQLWDKVQKLLTKKHRDIDLETNKNIFAGFIKCGDCGRAMMKNFWRRADGSKSYSYHSGRHSFASLIIHSIVELTKEVEKIIALRTRSRFKY